MIPSRKPNAAEKAKLLAMHQQLNALQAEHYRLTLMDSTGKKPPINLGKGKGPGGEEKFFTADEVKQKVRLLSAKNAQGYNVYITPVDSRRHYLLLDDLKHTDLRDLRSLKYRPTLIQETSEASFQAVSILQKDEVSHRAGNALFLRLNRRHGDRNISGFVHPFRLAGFANKKPARQRPDGSSPFVSLELAAFRVDRKATEKAKEFDEEMGEAVAAKAPSAASAPVVSKRLGPLETSAAMAWYQRRLDFWGDDADLSKIDREFAVHLRAQGFAKRAVKDAILNESPDVDLRHPRIEEYLESKVADLYPPEAEQNAGAAPKATTSAGPKPR